MKINDFILRPEVNALNRFTLFKKGIGYRKVTGQEDEPYDKEDTIAYGVTLFKALQIISFTETVDQNIQEWEVWQKAYEKKMDSLVEKLDPINKMLYEYMQDKKK